MDTEALILKTEPYAHQREALRLAFGREAFALLMEQGTGKTKVILDEAANLWARGRIGALVVIAPNGVHRNWVTREAPAHLGVPHVAAYWAASMRAKEKDAWGRLWHPHRDGLRLFAFNVEAFSRPKGTAVVEARKVLNAFACMVVIDESTRIKTPGATRTKVINALARHTAYRRILTGTPIENGPLDVYAQFRFLDPTILGWSTFAGYRNHYAAWEKRRTSTNRRGWYEELVGYRNLPELSQRIMAHAYRVRKEDCLDLPPKVYEVREVDLSREQRALYASLEEDGIARLTGQDARDGPLADDRYNDPAERLWALLTDEEGVVRGRNALTVLLRLQQIVGGFVTDEARKTHPVPGPNPRLAALMDLVEELDGKAIIWARFVPEIRAIADALRKVGYIVVEYHGAVKNADREVAVDSLQRGPARFFVGQPHSGGLGLTLTAARSVIYYSNDFSYGTRAQSEDRAHRIGQNRSVTYFDLVARGTVDEKIAGALELKRSMAEEIIDNEHKVSSENGY